MANTVFTDATKIEQLADAFVGREHEIGSYQMNIDNYTAMLAALPTGDWPADLLPYRDIKIIDIDLNVTINIDLLTDYQLRDDLTKRVRTENAAMRTIQHIKNAIDGQLPSVAAEKTTAINAAVSRRDAALLKASA